MKRSQSSTFFIPSAKSYELTDLDCKDKASPSSVSSLIFGESIFSQRKVLKFHERFQELIKDYLVSSMCRLEIDKILTRTSMLAFREVLPHATSEADLSTLILNLDSKISFYEKLIEPSYPLKQEIDLIRFIYLLKEKKYWIRLLKQNNSQRQYLVDLFDTPSEVVQPKKNKFHIFLYQLTQESVELKKMYRDILLAQSGRHNLFLSLLKNPDMNSSLLMDKITILEGEKDLTYAHILSISKQLKEIDKHHHQLLTTTGIRIQELIRRYPRGLEFDASWLEVNPSLFHYVRILVETARITDLLILEQNIRRLPTLSVIKTEGDDFDHYVDFIEPHLEEHASMKVESSIGSGYFHGRFNHLMALNYVLTMIASVSGCFAVYSIQR
jgi:hypothetical protein